jgi:hypothetical protein
MNRFSSRLAHPAALACALVLASGAAGPAGAQAVRGMTVSTPTAGQEWGSDAMVATLEELARLGVNWVAIHPYGGIREDGTVGRSRIDGLYRNPYWLTRAIEEAHRLGIRILIKPHLAYWGTDFSWRGEIGFQDEAEWARFFSSYEEWIVRVARLSAAADAFAVGTELDLTVGHEQEWRHIIAAVRGETEAALTYCASWNRYEEVPFWDDLDAIGIQAYFPLVEHDGMPSAEEIREGWDGIVARLDAFAEAQDRWIVFGELGYNRSLEAAVRPWEYRQNSDPRAEELQALCLDAALASVAGSRRIVGAFLWKWFPGELPHGNFRMSAPAMRGVISRHWAAPAR